MLAFPGMLLPHANNAGMLVPSNPEQHEEQREEYPHFHVFCLVQLGNPIRDPQDVWENAKVIAQVPMEKIREITLQELISAGLRICT